MPAPDSTRRLLWLHGFTGAPESHAPLDLRAWHVWAPLSVGHTGREWYGEPDPGPCVERIAERPLELPLQPTADWGLAHAGFDAEVDRLAAWARGHGFVRGHLAGYSLGARLALGLLLRHPDLFERATLISVHPGLEHDEERLARLVRDLDRCRVLRQQGTAAFARDWAQEPLFSSQSKLPKAARDAQDRIRTRHSAEGLLQSLLACGLASMPSTRTRLPTVTQPVTLLTGGLDAKFTTIAQHLVRWLPNARHVVFDGAGHNLPLERPAELRQLLLG